MAKDAQPIRSMIDPAVKSEDKELLTINFIYQEDTKKIALVIEQISRLEKNSIWLGRVILPLLCIVQKQ